MITEEEISNEELLEPFMRWRINMIGVNPGPHPASIYLRTNEGKYEFIEEGDPYALLETFAVRSLSEPMFLHMLGTAIQIDPETQEETGHVIRCHVLLFSAGTRIATATAFESEDDESGYTLKVMDDPGEGMFIDTFHNHRINHLEKQISTVLN